MKQMRIALFLSATAVGIAGCRTEQLKAAEANPKAQASQPAPSQTDCDAIKDPGQAEDCRFLGKVEAARKRNKSDNVVKHNPGSIQQP